MYYNVSRAIKVNGINIPSGGLLQTDFLTDLFPVFHHSCTKLNEELTYTIFFKLNNFTNLLLLHFTYPKTSGGRWDITDDFTTSFLHFSLFSTALWDLVNSRPVNSLMLSFHLFLSLPCLLPPFTVSSKMVLARPDEQETCEYHVNRRSLRWSGGLHVVRLPAGSWHRLPRR